MMPNEPDVRYIVPEILTEDDIAEAHHALKELARILGSASADASHRLGISFDMDDPQVARDVMMTTFEALVLSKPSKRGKAEESSG